MDSPKKRSKFVEEVNELESLIDECGCLMSNGDFDAVKDAFKNSLFARYVKENEEYQETLRERALENDESKKEMIDFLKSMVVD